MSPLWPFAFTGSQLGFAVGVSAAGWVFGRVYFWVQRASRGDLLAAFAALAAAQVVVSLTAALVGRLQQKLLLQARPVPRWAAATLLGSELGALLVASPVLTAAAGFSSDWFEASDIVLLALALLGPGLALGILQARALIDAGAGPRARFWIVAQGAGVPLAAAGIAGGFWLAARDHPVALPATLLWLALIWWSMGRVLFGLAAPREPR